MSKQETVEPQYQGCVEMRSEKGLTTFGLMSNYVWHTDPKRLVFSLARYKFVSKMFSGMNHVLEIGCADAFGARLVLQEVNEVTAIDFDPVFIEDVITRMDQDWKIIAQVHDILDGPVVGQFDGAFSLDVLEHISSDHEDQFISNIVNSISDHGVLIIGSPSIQSQEYASPASKAGHINCKDHIELKRLLSQYFHNVFIFSMNDEIVHTGFYPMAHYLFALCVAKK